MARTRQTARISTAGGRRPSRQYPCITADGGASERQAVMFQETRARTVVVEGQAEFHETPDVAHLSFLVDEMADSIPEGIANVLAQISEIRRVATEDCGISNESISSDSIGSEEQTIEYDDDDDSENDSDDDDKKGGKTRKEPVIKYHVKSVVRICLEGMEQMALFGKVCFAVMYKVGVRSFEAPRYELTKINELRNIARKGACENAKCKAEAILTALDDDRIRLGRPITITDVPFDLRDDAESSFLGNIRWFRPTTRRRQRRRRRQRADGGSSSGGGDVDDDDDDGGSSTKRSRSSNNSNNTRQEEQEEEEKDREEDEVGTADFKLEEDSASQMFVVPPIHIMACIKVTFEIEEVIEPIPGLTLPQKK